MQYNQRVTKIIAILIVFLIGLTPDTFAFYSPALNKDANYVKQDLRDSKTINGQGNLQQAYDKMKSNANSGLQNIFIDAIKDTITQSLTDSFMDGLSLLFGRWIGTGVWISDCLRDDVWELQALQEQVLAEVLRTAILNDVNHSNKLYSDYKFLGLDYNNLKDNFRNGALWFPNSKNLYIDCPYNAFTMAWNRLKNAFNSFGNLGKGNLSMGAFSLEMMKVVAQKRAEIEAQNWIRKNQLTLTFGGTEGGIPTNVLSGAGLNSVIGSIQTQFNYLSSMFNMIYTNTLNAFSGVGYNLTGAPPATNIDTYIKAVQAAADAKKRAEDQARNAIKFNLSLNNVADNQLKDIDQVLSDTDIIIKGAVQTKYSKDNLRTFCDKFIVLMKTQAKNRTSGMKFTCQ